MSITQFFEPSVFVSCPPPGSVNVRIGRAVEGPGGRWIPCASETAHGTYLACIYEVGPGRKQVCVGDRATHSIDDALSCATEVAATAAA